MEKSGMPVSKVTDAVYEALKSGGFMRADGGMHLPNNIAILATALAV